MEERFSSSVRRALENQDHEGDVIASWSTSVGSAHGILVHTEAGVSQGGADPRRDEFAIAFSSDTINERR